MAEQYLKAHANNSSDMPPEDSTKEQGCFGFMTKKEHKSDHDQDLVMTDLNAAKETKEEKHTLMDELQRTHSNSSSSSEEEVEEGGERKKKKKKKEEEEEEGLKEAIKEKIYGNKEGENTGELKETCNIPMDKCSGDHEEENKGILEKIKEKLPGKKSEEDTQTPPESATDVHAKEKKGLIDKIKEKLPGHHSTNENHDVVNSTNHVN